MSKRKDVCIEVCGKPTKPSDDGLSLALGALIFGGGLM